MVKLLQEVGKSLLRSRAVIHKRPPHVMVFFRSGDVSRTAIRGQVYTFHKKCIRPGCLASVASDSFGIDRRISNFTAMESCATFSPLIEPGKSDSVIRILSFPTQEIKI
jgi:hypothetical protein